MYRNFHVEDIFVFGDKDRRLHFLRDLREHYHANSLLVKVTQFNNPINLFKGGNQDVQLSL